jgi:hypothetical protein
MEKRKRKIISKLRNKHRFVIINDNTFEEKFSFRLTLLNILSLASVLLIVFSLSMYAIFAYTPMRNLIPKELTGSERLELIQLNQELLDVKQELETRNHKIGVMNDLLSGKETNYDSSSVRPNSNRSN